MVELTIVIAVIAVLASIIIPKLKTSRDKTALEGCKANIRHIFIAMEIYAGENGGNYTPSPAGSYYNCSYLVPNYLKATPICPLGNHYYIQSNHAAHRSSPAGCTLIWCDTYDAGFVNHAGKATACPYYWIGGGYVREN